jgi:hypothetical protein
MVDPKCVALIGRRTELSRLSYAAGDANLQLPLKIHECGPGPAAWNEAWQVAVQDKVAVDSR